MHTQTHVCIHICIHTHMHTHTHACIPYVYICTCILRCMHAYDTVYSAYNTCTHCMHAYRCAIVKDNASAKALIVPRPSTVCMHICICTCSHACARAFAHLCVWLGARRPNEVYTHTHLCVHARVHTRGSTQYAALALAQAWAEAAAADNYNTPALAQTILD